MAGKRVPKVALSGKQKWLLALLGEKVAPRRAKMDPIRIMKVLFVFAQETPKKWVVKNWRYDFVPYSYGPCSFEVYSDLDALEGEGLLSVEPSLGRSWRYYSLSAEGQQVYRQLRARLNEDALRYMKALKKLFLRLPFTQLLDLIYKKYPEFASKSVFRS